MKTTSLILVAALIAAPMRSEEPRPVQPKAGPAAAAVVVVVIGGFVIWKMIRFCKRKFPKNTNGTPGNAMMNTRYGAAFSVSGTCDNDGEDGTGTSFYVMVSPSGNVQTVSSSFVQDLKATQSQVASNGLSMVPVVGASSYSKDGQPIPEGQSPIKYDGVARVVTVGAGGQMIRIERSKDLKEWESMGTVNMPAGHTLQIEDASQQGQMFYRVIR